MPALAHFYRIQWPRHDRQMEEMRRTMLFTMMSNEARERLARIKIVKEDKARMVEDVLLRMV